MPLFEIIIMPVSTRKLKLGLQIPYVFTEKVNELSNLIDTEGCSVDSLKEIVYNDLISIAGKKLVCDSRGEEGKTDMECAMEFYYPDIYEMFYSCLRNPDQAEEATVNYINTMNDFSNWVTEIPEAKEVVKKLSLFAEDGDPDARLDIHLDYTLSPDENTLVAIFDITPSSTF